MNNNYRYQLEKYRGRGTRYVCPQCGRKYTFTKYIDTYNNNIYVNDKVGKCNRLDKCGYHYTPRQYFEDNPWLTDGGWLVNSLGNQPTNHRTPPQPPPPRGYIPEWVFERSRNVPVLPLCHLERSVVEGSAESREIRTDYQILHFVQNDRE